MQGAGEEEREGKLGEHKAKSKGRNLVARVQNPRAPLSPACTCPSGKRLWAALPPFRTTQLGRPTDRPLNHPVYYKSLRPRVRLQRLTRHTDEAASISTQSERVPSQPPRTRTRPDTREAPRALTNSRPPSWRLRAVCPMAATNGC